MADPLDIPWACYLCPVTSRYLDPFEAYRLLGHYSRGKWNEWVGDDGGLTNKGLLIDAARRALNMPRPDPKTGVGWVEPQVEKALALFAEYVEKKGQTAADSPPSPPPSIWPWGKTHTPCSDCP